MTTMQNLGRRCVAAALALVAATLPPVASAQTPLPNPNLSLSRSGYILATLGFPDGSVIVGGHFSSINGQAHANIARFLGNGSLDSSWTTSIDGGGFEVDALAADASGNVYVGGYFASANGTPRNGLAKLLSEGSLDATWNPAITDSNGGVSAIAVDAAGNVFVGGFFTQIGGQSHVNLALVSAAGSGAADATWNPAPDNVVYALQRDATGHLFVGGTFTTIGGQARLGLAELSIGGAGLADASWKPDPTGTFGIVSKLALEGGNLYVGGHYSSIGGQSRNGLAKVSVAGVGAADASWDPAPAAVGGDAQVSSLALDGTGNLYVGGLFDHIGGQARGYVAKLSTTGSGAAAPSWNPSANFMVMSLALVSGSVVAGGTFDSVGGALRMGLARVSDTGALDATSMDTELPGNVFSMVALDDGGVVVGGKFLKVGALPRRNLLRLQPDGSLDTTWDVPTDQFVQGVAKDGSGHVYAGGAFTNVQGQVRNHIARMSLAGVLDGAWNPDADDLVYSFAVDTDGSVFAGGAFTHIGGQTRANLAKLSPTATGLADATWNPATEYPGDLVWSLTLDGHGNLYAGGTFAYLTTSGEYGFVGKFPTTGAGQGDAGFLAQYDSSVYSMFVDGAGRLYTGGIFQHVQPTLKPYLARVSADVGTLDTAWNPAPNARVYTIVPDASGNLYVGGRFNHMGAATRSYVARVSRSGTGAVDPDWNPSANSFVHTMVIARGGRLIVGGDFTQIGGQARVGVAAFQLDSIFTDGFEAQ